MGRLAVSLLCALICHGLLVFLPVAEQGRVLSQLPGESSITIHLTAALPAKKQPIAGQAAQPVLIRPEHKKKRIARVAAQEPASLQPADSRPAAVSASSPSPVDRNGSNVPVLVKATPLYQSNPKPVYPPLARRRGQQGTVMLQVMVSENGRVEQVTLQRSSGFALLDKAALDTVKKWQFFPGTENDRPVTSKVLVPVHFILQ
jgi:protein TonB